MMRSLWTAGSGMTAQQLNVDVISNNLANVNTNGYKKESAEFKDLLYQTMDRAYVLNGTGKPVNLQVGHGTYVSATARDFGAGNLVNTGNPVDMAIDGAAFFSVQGPNGLNMFTKDGSFKATLTDQGVMLTTSDGLPILDDSGNQINIPSGVDLSKLSISPEGNISYQETGSDGLPTSVDQGQKVGLFKFANVQGLESIGGDLYVPTSASGTPTLDSDSGTKSVLKQGFLESSNVQVVEEMVKLIVAQRAYEVNSKAIQSSDEMLGMANNLKR
jgi:flagellar basal-body rod protein FlgG